VPYLFYWDYLGQQAIPMKNRLKVLRAERDWTQANLADELGVSRQTVNAIEKGKFDPSLPLAFKVARLFELSIEDIFQDNPTTPTTTPNAVRA
jgi:putative transcriptional regulator